MNTGAAVAARDCRAGRWRWIWCGAKLCGLAGPGRDDPHAMHEPLDDDLPGDVLDARTAALRERVAAVVGRPCRGCGSTLCGHGAVLAVLLGYRHAPRCSVCIAAELGEPPPALAARALEWITRRDCFLHVWREASAAEGAPDPDRPPCHFAAAPAVSGVAPTSDPAPARPAASAAEASYDAGDLGCGDLVLELRARLRELPPGGILHLVARDPAAPVDLPAWCGLTGHHLDSSDHPHYVLRRRHDP